MTKGFSAYFSPTLKSHVDWHSSFPVLVCSLVLLETSRPCFFPFRVSQHIPSIPGKVEISAVCWPWHDPQTVQHLPALIIRRSQNLASSFRTVVPGWTLETIHCTVEPDPRLPISLSEKVRQISGEFHSLTCCLKHFHLMVGPGPERSNVSASS